ncbi:hypothetical protein B0X71_06855 [Planococcus lenghuensis]|uniref:DUF1294 domain-containing protein n=2 Tax=Planococcus lenghuensis TaxID=2213202 RepID=A0A1Q2L3M9_9BACL|nr:hypothetical protein B0X71_06855 [Planococcus lenghuensis]
MNVLGLELGVLILFAGMNVYAFVLMGTDKRRAEQGKWRIPEQRLWTAAVLGGGIGAYFGMRHFRHKTKRTNFRIGFPALAAVETVAVVWLLFV